MGRDCASEHAPIVLAGASHRTRPGAALGSHTLPACSRELPPVFVATERAAFDCLAIARIAGFHSPMGMVMLSERKS
jgi:hypothetical protein